jgi:hypothetical protein
METDQQYRSRRRRKAAPVTRTIKIGDEIHHQLRIMSVIRREPMQALADRLLKAGIQQEQIGAFSR